MLRRWSKCFQLENSKLSASVLPPDPLCFSPSCPLLQRLTLPHGFWLGLAEWSRAGDWKKRDGRLVFILPAPSCISPLHIALSLVLASTLFSCLHKTPEWHWCLTAPGHRTVSIFVNGPQVAQLDMPSLSCHDPQTHQLIIQEYYDAKEIIIFFH